MVIRQKALIPTLPSASERQAFGGTNISIPIILVTLFIQSQVKDSSRNGVFLKVALNKTCLCSILSASMQICTHFIYLNLSILKLIHTMSKVLLGLNLPWHSLQKVCISLNYLSHLFRLLKLG